MSEEANKPPKKVLFEGLINKLKKIKHLDIILTVLFIAIILLIYFSTFSTSSNGVNLTDSDKKILNTYRKVRFF